jgi:hypothetical protein
MQKLREGSLLLLMICSSLPAADRDLSGALLRLRAVQLAGAGHRDAVAAAQQVAAASPSELTQILAAMDGVNPVAENWIRGAAEAVAQRSGKQLPVESLEGFLMNAEHSPRARRLAYEFIAAVDRSAESRLIPRLLDDSSLELRRDAVAQVLEGAVKAATKDEQVKSFQTAFEHARDLDQIKAAAAKLKDLGAPANISRHMGFVLTWHILGPFDNAGDAGWNVAYPPESTIDLAAECEGQKGRIKWIDHTTSDEYGKVDLTKALDKHKGAVAYAYAAFQTAQEQPCELRLSSPNSNKIWLNGKLLTENHVYHAGDPIDQYVGQGQLKRGLNSILVKVCQNEQTEDWAQRWEFKLRVCDKIGSAIVSLERVEELGEVGRGAGK